MSSIRIPLAFHTAVHGYSWHCTNVWFSENDYALIEERLFAGNAVGVNPIACVFTCGDRVIFFRHLKAENYDFDMRSSDYYVVGIVRKHDAKNLDFKWIFENERFVTPIRREAAMSDDFPPYLDYEGGRATDGIPPSENHPKQVDSEILSSIGSWIEHEGGDLVVYITGDIANPTIEVKFERKIDASSGSNESDDFKERGSVDCEASESREQLNEGGVPAGESNRNSETSAEGVLSKIRRLLGRALGLGRSVDVDKSVGIKDRHYFIPKEKHDMTQVGRSRKCPYCRGTGWISDSSQ